MGYQAIKYIPWRLINCFVGADGGNVERQLQGDHFVFNYVDFLKSVDVPSEDVWVKLEPVKAKIICKR